MSRGLRSALIALVSIGLFAVLAARRPEPAVPFSERLVRDGPPRFWKGNLHTHSFWSDGDDFPEMIADWYKSRGYHFLGLSDHNILAEGERWIDAAPEDGPRGRAVSKYLSHFGRSWVERREEPKQQVRLKPLREFRSWLEEPGRFLLIPAEEITHQFSKAPVHMNAINPRDVLKPINGDSVTETIRVNLRAVQDQQKRTGWRMISFLNHPNFGWGVRAEDFALADEVRFFEVYNGHPGVRNYGDAVHAASERMWDIALALRLGKHRLPVLFGLATDDAHHYHVMAVGKSNPGRGWVMVRAPYLSAEAILRGMEAGDFYASTGVVLDDVKRGGDEMSVTIRPAKGVTYRTQFIGTLQDAPLGSTPVSDKDGKPLPVTGQYSAEIGKVLAESEELTPSYRFTGKELYVRAKVISSRLHPNPFAKGDVEVAWTQPVVP